MPETSIIIRTFNEEKHIGNLLKAIKEQDYHDYEIVLVDSGSTDNTLKIAKDLGCDSVLEIQSQDFTFGYSLNIGCRASKGKYIVLISAHAVPVDNHWLSSLLAPFQDNKVAMVYGRQIGNEKTKFSEKRDFQRLFGDSSFDSDVFLYYANNANSAIKKELWQEHPFDEYLLGLEDIDWAKHVTQKGLLIHYAPEAGIYHIHQEKWPQVFNRYRREAIAAARIGLAHPPQVRPNIFWIVEKLFEDLLASFPKISLSRIKEIGLFRYYQWKGTRQGLYYDKDIDVLREKYTLFYPAANQAVVVSNKGQASLKEIPLPELKPSEVLIEVAYVGVCRTDLEVYEGTLGYYHQGLARYPIVPGHEFSGTVVRVGANCRENFEIGDKVVGECILSRGPERREVGVVNYNGAYSQFIVLPAKYLHKIPANLDLKTASLTEPLAVVLRAMRRVSHRLKPNSTCAVIGAGTIGNLCSQVLKHSGFSVTVFDKNKDKLYLLKDKIEAGHQELNNLSRFDLIVEATGERTVLPPILKESSPDATLLLLGFPYGPINYNFEDLVGGEKVIVGSVGGANEDFQKALQLLPELDTYPFTQQILALKDFSRAWKLQQDSKQLKVILKVQKDK